MRFLIDADLPRLVATVLRDCGHEAIDLRDIGMGSAKDPEVARYAGDNSLCLVSADRGFADVRAFPPEKYHGIVVIGLPDDAVAQQIGEIVRLLCDQTHILPYLSGRLAIVEKQRIRLRPPL